MTLISLPSIAQQQQVAPEKEELRLSLNASGSHYLKVTFLNQIWIRSNKSNPGTLTLGEPADRTVDFGLRRTRFQLYGQVNDHVFVYFQAGQNNFNYLAGQNATNSGNRKTQFFIHDALAEYRMKNGSDRLYVGTGLTIANGLSRFSQPSVGTIMSMDVPIFAQATVDATDEFSRKLSVYARGQAGKLDYRLVVSDPFPITSNGQPQVPINPVNATFAYNRHHKQYQALLIWNFMEQEAHATPYMTGTYLGKKNILNLEAGIIDQRNATWTGDPSSPTYHRMRLWSVAAFLDRPVGEKGSAVNAYAGYFRTDYGPGYLRYNGIMNPANGTAVSGAPPNFFGNAFPMFGTGSVWYGQFGYLFHKDVLGEGRGQLMPYATLQHANLDRLTGLMNVYDLGVNWFIKGHSSKITLDYQSRPVYAVSGADLNRDSRRHQVVLQYQVFF